MATGQAGPESQQRKLTVAELLRVTAPSYVQHYGAQAVPHVQSTLAKLALCRTQALGGRWYRCDDCQQECKIYNSCGDRHCPQCAGAKRAEWTASAAELILEGVEYFQVVFTLPSKLSDLALGNQKAIYDLLFRSAWNALKQTIETEQGYDPAALLVLHTWNQRLGPHAHVHAVVPGGGPALDGNGWVNSRRRHGDDASGYLVDAVTLRRAFRDQFLAGLARLRERGELKLQARFEHLQDDDDWESWLAKLKETEWVSYIEPPPRRSDGVECSAEQVLKYLARYLTGGPISDRRILAADHNEVVFWAREGKTPGGDDQRVPIRLSALEFTRRWCLHILPASYTKTRRFGGWANRRRSTYLERCAILLESADAPLSADAIEFDPDVFLKDEQEELALPCPACGNQLRLMAEQNKPSWFEIMNSTFRPVWYRPWKRQDLASSPRGTIEFAKGKVLDRMTKFNAQSIPLHPTPG